MLDKEEARRRRQERILKRGSDRLSRIKSSLHESLQEPIADNAVAALQDDKAPQMCPPRNAGSETPPLSSLSSEPGSGTESETSKVMSSTHDRLSTAAMAQSLSTQSPGTLSPPRPSTPTPRRRVGNLARKIRSSGNGIVNSQSVDMDNIDRLLAQQFFESSSLDGDDKTSALAAGPQGTAGYRSVTATSQIKGSQQPKTSARSAGSNAEDKLSPRTKALLESLDKEGVPSGQHDTGLSSLFTPMPRQFTIAGVVRASVQLIPTLSLMGYALWRERCFTRHVSRWRTRQKLADLVAERPDPVLDDWVEGNHIGLYMLAVQVLAFSAYILLGPNLTLNAQTAPRLLIKFSDRVVNSLCLLVFLTGASILASYIIL